MVRADGDTSHHALFWGPSVDGALRYDWVWLTRDGTAASVWIPPNGTEMSDEQLDRLVELVHTWLDPQGGAAFLELLRRFDRSHPRDEPHYYLSLLGTHPEHRGHGVGMQLLRDNLATIDAEGAPAYLESSNPANNGRYMAVGFEPICEFTYPAEDGPVVTGMWRSARTPMTRA